MKALPFYFLFDFFSPKKTKFVFVFVFFLFLISSFIVKVYSIQLEEWNGRRWVPFLANDVQFEFIMLDPHVRRVMSHNDKGVYTIEFQLPDRYGVFTFRVDYQRLGYSFFTAIERSPVRPFRHNQYERFIDAAFPYYASSFSLMVGLFLFSWVFLYHRDSKQTN